MKEKRKRRLDEGLVMVPLIVPLGIGSQVLCRHCSAKGMEGEFLLFSTEGKPWG